MINQCVLVITNVQIYFQMRLAATVVAVMIYSCQGIPAPYRFPSESTLPIITVSHYPSSDESLSSETRIDPLGRNFNFTVLEIVGRSRLPRFVPETSYKDTDGYVFLQVEEPSRNSTQDSLVTTTPAPLIS